MGGLLLVDSVGQVMLADAESGARVALGKPHEPALRARATTAVWSDQGRWAAWSLASADPDGAKEIRLHDTATDTTTVLADSLTAFYLCPSPCGRYLSHLSPGPLGLELALSDLRTGELQIIERGQPLFWAWSPDASRLAVHVQNRVSVVPLDGSDSLVVTNEAGPFIAPWWLPGGSVVAVIGGQIVYGNPDGSTATLVENAGSCRFALDPDGRRLAMVEVLDGCHNVVVRDLLTGQTEPVSSEQTAAFFWSPDGRHLAVLVLASATELQWLVFDGNDVARLQPFHPGRTWIENVLPFFEQYAQSHAVWSSDGSRLVAISSDEGGRSEAIIQCVEPPFTVQRIADAELAWWVSD